MVQSFPICKKFSWVAIKNCSIDSLKNFKNESKIISPPMEIPVLGLITKWHLELYPNGQNKGHEKNLSLFMVRDDKYTFWFTFKYTLSILGSAGKYAKKSRRLNNDSFRESIGTVKYLSHQLVSEMPEMYLPDGNLTICCEFIILSRNPTDVPPSKLPALVSTDIQKMYEKELFTDFEFRCNDGVSVKCHKCVLGARSPVFEAMLSNDMEETREGFAEVPDYDSTLMKKFLQFIYCGSVQEIGKFAIDLIFLADKYDLEVLKQMCIKSIMKSLTKGNVVQYFQIADKVSGCDRLFEECIVLIEGDISKISKTQAWNELSEEMIEKITKHVEVEIERV